MKNKSPLKQIRGKQSLTGLESFTDYNKILPGLGNSLNKYRDNLMSQNREMSNKPIDLSYNASDIPKSPVTDEVIQPTNPTINMNQDPMTNTTTNQNPVTNTTTNRSIDVNAVGDPYSATPSVFNENEIGQAEKLYGGIYGKQALMNLGTPLNQESTYESPATIIEEDGEAIKSGINAISGVIVDATKTKKEENPLEKQEEY